MDTRAASSATRTKNDQRAFASALEELGVPASVSVVRRRPPSTTPTQPQVERTMVQQGGPESQLSAQSRFEVRARARAFQEPRRRAQP